MLEKKTIVDLIEVTETGLVQVRTKTSVLENNVEISSSFSRHVIAPGECGQSEDSRVIAICGAVHTADVVSAYRALIDSTRASL